jgi:prophage regulatory protein
MANLKVLRKQSVLDTIGVSSATLWRMCKGGRFPKPIELGSNSVGWVESEIQDWLADRMSQRNQ